MLPSRVEQMCIQINFAIVSDGRGQLMTRARYVNLGSSIMTARRQHLAMHAPLENIRDRAQRIVLNARKDLPISMPMRQEYATQLFLLPRGV
jgi:hypothetical protein